MLDVSIIIVNYNTLQITQNCIDSVVEKTHGVEYEIILVDNASTDGSKEFFEKDPRLTYVYSECNGGFGYGNNLGMKIAKGKYFFLLNSDTLLVNNAIKEFYDYAQSNDEKAVYGCYLQHIDGSYCNSFFFFPAFTIKDFLKRQIFKQDYGAGDYQARRVDAVSGADMFFHRELFERTGGFDEAIFLYGEEGEWIYRLLKLNYDCWLIPQPKIIHLEGKSMKMTPSKMAIKLSSHFYILRKHMSYPVYILARMYYAFNLLTRNILHIGQSEYRNLFHSIFVPINV